MEGFYTLEMMKNQESTEGSVEFEGSTRDDDQS
jgi:hypothetical protein